jgi:hypothetical protein
MIENKKNISIKELVIKEPERKAVKFNPVTDIREDEWDGFFESLHVYYTTRTIMLGMASYLDEKRVNASSIKEEVWDESYEKLKTLETQYFRRDLITGYQFLHNYFFTRKLYPGLDEIEQMKNITRDKTKKYIEEGILPNHYFPSLLFPDILDEYNDKFYIQSEKNRLAKQLKKAQTNNEWESLAEIAAKAKIEFPELMMQNPLSNEMWENLKERLHTLSAEFAWSRFISTAFYLQILAAEKVVENNDGVHFIMPKERNQLVTVNEIPQRRRF